MSDLSVDYDNDESNESDIIGMKGGLWLTWSDFWEEIAEARESCVDKEMFFDTVSNIIDYYDVCVEMESIKYE